MKDHYSPLDIDLLTADQVAELLGSTRSTILQIKDRIGYTKPVKEVFFTLEDVLIFVMMRRYKPAVDTNKEDENRRKEARKLVRGILQKMKAA